MRFVIQVWIDAVAALGPGQNWYELRDEIQQEVETQINEKLIGRNLVAFKKPVFVEVKVR